jgi:threonine/homoserine/homoserine lactone efflux protein
MPMFDAVASALAGIALGLSLAAPPGPMNAIIAEESVLRGWGSGFRAGLGAMTADAAFLGLALLGVVAVVQDAPTARGLLFGLGGLLMLYFAYGAATDARATFGGGTDGAETAAADDAGAAATDGAGSSGERDSGDSKGFRKAFALALTNPYQILWWLTAGVGLLDPGTVTIDALGGLSVSTGSPVIVLGFFGGILVWITGFPAALVTAGRRVDAFAPAVAYLSAAVLALAGLSFLGQAVGVLA